MRQQKVGSSMVLMIMILIDTAIKSIFLSCQSCTINSCSTHIHSIYQQLVMITRNNKALHHFKGKIPSNRIKVQNNTIRHRLIYFSKNIQHFCLQLPHPNHRVLLSLQYKQWTQKSFTISRQLFNQFNLILLPYNNNNININTTLYNNNFKVLILWNI